MNKLLAIIAGVALIGCNSAASRYIPKDNPVKLFDEYKLESLSEISGVPVRRFIIPENKNKVFEDGIPVDNTFSVFSMLMNNSRMFRKLGDSYKGEAIK
jgi:hypothetical protein